MPGFLTESEQKLCDEFIEKGIVKIAVEGDGLGVLSMIRRRVCEYLAVDNLNTYLASPQALNKDRISIISMLNSDPWLRPAYYSLARNALNAIVGNELVMQRNVNLSIQLPGDDSSLLPIHGDTWSGDSPYEVVLWVPLVDCYDTKSMYFCDKRVSETTNIYDYSDAEALYQAVKDHCTFMDVKYGEALIFSQNIMHGNRVNETNETRWSMNCRFKSALSPYADKKLGEFFEPITLRPATRLGMRYEYPKI
jgi:sporadic carbohydrate cluster 2OG-Fe(II) oxygenase